LRLVARERKVKLSVFLPGLSQKDAESPAEDAHGRCRCSRAIRGNVDVTLRVTV
jgi:organic hydroperoxide reductase OsmC/OhrA